MTPDQIPDPRLDDDVRAMLHRRAETVQPGDGYPTIQRKLAEAPVGSRLWGANPALVAVAAVLALLVGAGVVAIAVRGSDDSGLSTTDRPPASTAPPTTPSPPPPPTTTTTTTVAPTEAPTTIVPPEPPPTTIAPTTAAPTTTVPEPVTTPITDASTLTIDGIGPITLPILRDDFEARTGQKLTPPSGDFPGSPCDFTRIVGGPDNVVFMTDEEHLVRLDSSSSASGLEPIRTDAGIGFGSTRAEVFAAYPGAVDNTSEYGQPEIIVIDPARPGYKLNFGLTGDTVSSLRAGVSQFVDYPEGCA